MRLCLYKQANKQECCGHVRTFVRWRMVGTHTDGMTKDENNKDMTYTAR